MGEGQEKRSLSPLEFYLAYRRQRALLSIVRLASGLLAGALAASPLTGERCIAVVPLAFSLHIVSALVLKKRLTLLSQRELWFVGLAQLVAGMFIGLVLGPA